MKLLKTCIVAGVLLSILVGMMVPLYKTQNYNSLHESAYHTLDEPRAAAGEPYASINDIFNEKYNEFTAQDYFSQTYESSLQATYYALYILNSMDKLDQVNQTAIFNYIMSYYDEGSERFMDSYAERYLQTDFSELIYYFPFPSLLEVNCYAILSLDILGNLTAINKQDAKDFIWSCFNQPTNRGFIGQPYSPSLHPYFKISTIDNTYHAILALEVLGDDPSVHSEEWLGTEYFIKDFQNTTVSSVFYGGFFNDEVEIFHSLDNLDFTLLSSYYCIQSLKKLNSNMLYDEFHQFLDKHYNNSVPYFEMSIAIVPTNYSDIVGTALGLQLSDISGYSAIDRNGVIDFILNNRNSWGIWDASRYYPYHELTDTFQVIRALEETGELLCLSSNEKDQIAVSIENYFQQYDNGFSLLSKDYTSLRLIHTIVKSALGIYRKDQYNADFKQRIYDQILSSYHYEPDDHFFAGCINMFQQSTWLGGALISMDLRSRPVEFYSQLYDEFYNEIGIPYSHKATYYALETLYYIGMLGAFGNECDLNDLVGDIIETQFLSPSHANYGGFVSSSALNGRLDDDQKNNNVFLEYTFYAIRSLEILAKRLDLGHITDLGFNEYALESFVDTTAGDGTTIYYDPWYSDDITTILRNTYYMVYILNATAPEKLDSQKVSKIRNFVVQNLNYSDIKNIYYSYKISDYLDQAIEFDNELTNQLVRDIYDDDKNAFYLTSDREILSDEVFLWICDMAQDDDIQITALYPQSVELGNEFNITVYLNNIMLDYFGPDVNVKLDASFDHVTFERKSDMSYEGVVHIPDKIENYPVVTGNIEVSGGPIGGTLLLPITIQTTSNIFGSKDSSESAPQDDSEEGHIIEPSIQTALPVMITLIAVPSIVIVLSGKSKRKSNGIPIHNK